MTYNAQIRALALWIHRSPQRISQFRNDAEYIAQKDNQKYQGLLLDYDVDTRWNSVLQMLRTAFRQRDVRLTVVSYIIKLMSTKGYPPVCQESG